MNRVRGLLAGTFAWLDERLGAREILLPLARKKKVPVHRHTIWYFLGGMALFLFLLQVATGVLLLFYYRPSADEAYESVQFLMTQVQFGWLIRSIHSWGANLMVLTVFVHLFSVLFLKAYRPPRELTWVSGVLLLFLALGLGFTGYLLPWNELAFFATRVGTEIPGVLPVAGDFIRSFLRGGEDVTGATLTRFYALHVSVLPGLMFLLVAMHVFLVQRHNMSIPPSVQKAGGPKGFMPFVPDFLLRDIVGWLAVLALLAAAAAFFPAELGPKADPFAPAPQGIRPEWYFMFMFQTLKYLPSHIAGVDGELVGILAFGAAAAVLLLVPFLDRAAARGQKTTLWRNLALVALLYIFVLTYLGYTANPAQ